MWDCGGVGAGAAVWGPGHITLAHVHPAIGLSTPPRPPGASAEPRGRLWHGLCHPPGKWGSAATCFPNNSFQEPSDAKTLMVCPCSFWSDLFFEIFLYSPNFL